MGLDFGGLWSGVEPWPSTAGVSRRAEVVYPNSWEYYV